MRAHLCGDWTRIEFIVGSLAIGRDRRKVGEGIRRPRLVARRVEARSLVMGAHHPQGPLADRRTEELFGLSEGCVLVV